MLGRSTLSLARGARCMSSTAKVWVDENTKVICQGFTGKQVRPALGTVSAGDENHLTPYRPLFALYVLMQTPRACLYYFILLIVYG